MISMADKLYSFLRKHEGKPIPHFVLLDVIYADKPTRPTREHVQLAAVRHSIVVIRKRHKRDILNLHGVGYVLTPYKPSHDEAHESD